MRTFMLVAGLVFGLGACGSKSGLDGVLEKFEEFKDKTCKCDTLECAKKVSDEAEKWIGDQEKSLKDVKPTKEQDEKFDKLEDQMKACMEKLQAKEAPAPAAAP